MWATSTTQGAQIERNTCRVLESEVGRLDWTPVALLPEHAAGMPTRTQVDRRYNPPAPTTPSRSRLGQSTVAGLVRAALDALLPEPLDRVLVREEAEREQVARLFNQLNAR